MASALFASANGLSDEPFTLKLWAGDAPLAKGSAPADVPEITVHKPEAGKANGTAVLICPGGGYGVLMTSYEGHDVAKWFNSMGVTGIVLKNRIAPYMHPAPLLDAQRAMRTIRFNAKSWGIDTARVGVMGFSAGGHVASTLGTHCDAGDPKAADPVDRVGCRPDFMLLIYPVISLGPKGHAGSTANLVGQNPPPELVKLLSNELQTTKDTPPSFLAHSEQDQAVPVDNSQMFYDALKANGVPAELLRLKTGAHGLGCGKGEEWRQWQEACVAWLKGRGLVD